jgi:hypothetical protein
LSAAIDRSNSLKFFHLLNASILLHPQSLNKISHNKSLRDAIEKSCANYYGQSRDSLSCQGPGAKIFLFKGDTREVLPKVVNTLPMMDFIFIDSGHSLETIEND